MDRAVFLRDGIIARDGFSRAKIPQQCVDHRQQMLVRLKRAEH